MAGKRGWKNRNIGNIRIEKNPWIILSILLISVFALLINSYRYNVIDQALYISLLKKSLKLTVKVMNDDK
ncbi:TPA: hypothetical protein EYP66_20690 [Candidatus Poribacteria bacterium]|nr:hypothetical protein [Candidatus Poribacteria bacterium]